MELVRHVSTCRSELGKAGITRPTSDICLIVRTFIDLLVFIVRTFTEVWLIAHHKFMMSPEVLAKGHGTTLDGQHPEPELAGCQPVFSSNLLHLGRCEAYLVRQ